MRATTAAPRFVVNVVAGLVAMVAAAPVRAELPAPSSPAPPARAAIREFEVEGQGASPALGMQLQDGFLVGLLRSGIHVLDSVDVEKRLQLSPDLAKCDSSVCLKRIGEALGVRHILRVKVSVTGNSYRTTARLFGTHRAAVVLPVDTQSRFCDVCTVAEAREMMIRLAEAIKRPLEEQPVVVEAPPPPPRRSRGPIVGLSAGLVAMAAGVAAYFAADDPGGRTLPALGGALMGAGLVVSTFSVYLVSLDPIRPRAAPGPPRPAVVVALRW